MRAPSGRDDRGRGGRDRGGRDRKGRGDRGPRRDAERTEPAFDNSYAGYYDDSAPEPTGEPILLPGESIRKYRDPAEVAAEDAEARRNAPPAPEVVTIAAPAIEIVGWDGGAVLPGETLGRHRNRNNEPQRGRDNARYAAPVSAPAEPVAKTEPVRADTVEPTLPEDSFNSPQPVESTPAEEAAASPETPEQAAAEVSVDVEYEPVEGASASVQDSARRDLRRFEQPAEATPQAEVNAEDEPAAQEPDATVYDLNAAADEPVAPSSEPTADETHVPHVGSTPEDFTTRAGIGRDAVGGRSRGRIRASERVTAPAITGF